ncbi:C40 family peptidase [Neobacillus sp. CF12]|uniref:C40 family peptidase n=1 Tax=Neobacillus sp. CF12 TaxID=3055864 RepID=UPI0025A08AE6|nr:C40 family peptidase [Neobacillus sp. CF12]MDM5328605.1 NlpC/P60 family protein [Neobacillus sp. CF12]
MIKKFIKYTVAAVILATTLQATPTFANPVTKGQIDATKEQINNFETKIQQLDNRIILAMENSQKLNEEIKTQQEKIIETEAEIEKAEVALDNHKKVYSERLKSIQLKGDQSVVSYAELLLSSGSLSEFFNRFTAISQIIENDTDLLDGLNQKEKLLKEAEKQLHNQINQLEKSKLELASEQKQIEADKKQIEIDLAAAQSILQNQQNQMAQQVAQLAAQQQAQQAQQAQQPVTVNTNTPSASTPPTVPVNVTSSASANAVIANAKQYLGVPYVWGGSTPSGFDCSGFVQYVYRSVGISLPRTSRAQQNVGTRISVNQVQPGDLVFNGSPAYHVGIYIGGGQYIHAPQTGDVVKIASYDPSRFSSAARILP